MIRTVNPYPSARTAEIMSRYRPIAPKPETPAPENENSDVKKSPYLKNVWARSTRTWKRGRAAAPFGPLPSVKRRRTCFQCLSSPCQVITDSPVAKNFAMHGISTLGPVKCTLDAAVTTLAETVALPFLYRSAAQGKESLTKGIDLNMKADQGPEEVDFLPQLQSPVKPSVISPQPARPVRSSVIVESITGEPGRRIIMTEEVEEVVEAEEVPAIVSDSNNKVRVSNSEYKKMVGQPECGWLDCAGGGACRRIGGEVSIRFVDSEFQLSHCVHGFCCRVKIEWEIEGKKKCVNAYCEAAKLVCDAKDYKLLWRFHTTEASSFN